MTGEPGSGPRRRLPHVPGKDEAPGGDDELGFHLDMRIRDYLARGMTEEDARAAARTRLGDVDAVRRELDRLDRIDRRREALGELRQDLRYGVRTLARAPGFAAMAVATLGLGVGATTAMFSVVYTVLLAPLPYPAADRLVQVFETSPQGATRNPVSAGNVLDWQRGARSFALLGAYGSGFPVTLTGDGDAERVVLASMQPEVMRALDVAPALGRPLGAEDASGARVAVVSHSFWEARLGGRADALGRSLVLNDAAYTVVGVMPPSFAFPNDEVDVWVPVADDELDPTSRTSHNYLVLGRLAPSVTLEAARREMSALAGRIAGEHPSEMTGWGARVVPLREDLTRNVAGLLQVLLGGVLVVLLIACGNLANLLLARAVTRQREMAVRGALGAGRGRLVRQLLTESGLLAALGGLVGLGLAPLLLGALVAGAPAEVPLLTHAAIDVRMLGFTAAVTLGASLVFGLAPALSLSRSDLQSTLRTAVDASRAEHVRLRAALLVSQVALSVVLLVAAGLFVRSFRALQGIDPGFEPGGLATMEVDLPRPRYPGIAEQVALYERLLDHVRAIPGVATAATTSQPPGDRSGMTFSFAIEGRVASNASGREDDETLHAVSPGYFDALGQEVLAGRAFESGDDANGPPVVILNESLARKHFPGEEAVGHRIAFRVGETPWLEIVGVVADTRLESPDVEPQPGIFIPYAQRTWPWLTWSTVVARAAPGTDPASLRTALRGALRDVDPDLPPLSIGTVQGSFRENTAARTFAMMLVGGFGTLALLLCVVGLHGLVSYSVARERREIGVRMALGAASALVLGRVLGRSLRLSIVGAAAGLVAALVLSRLIEGLLFGVAPTDAATYAATVLVVLGVTLATTSLPAARAARTDPARALRTD